MPAAVKRGYLVLGDISGYTGYLATTELEHANEILADLLEQVVATLVPPLELAEVEGDAVFAFGPVSRGETALEAIEAAYDAFLRRRELMEARTSCPCNACRAIGSLELKFIVHWGEYVLQEVGGRVSPLGSDVNLAHRLLKNGVAADTGWQAYVLLTRAAADALALPLEGLHARTETYEHLGNVATESYDLRPRFEERRATERPEVDGESCDWQVTAEIAALPQRVWEILNDPHARAYWSESERVEHARALDGRTGAGTTIHCHHGDKLVTHKVVQWHPFEFMTEYLRVGPMTVAIGYLLEPDPDRTRLTLATRLLGRVPRAVARRLSRRNGNRYAVPQLARIRELAEAGEPASQAVVEVAHSE